MPSSSEEKESHMPQLTLDQLDSVVQKAKAKGVAGATPVFFKANADHKNQDVIAIGQAWELELGKYSETDAETAEVAPYVALSELA